MRNNVVKVILISLVALLIIVVGFAIVYATTDLFKSSKEIFEKYFIQDIEDTTNIASLKTENEYLNKLKEKDYNDNSQIILKYRNSQGNQENFTAAVTGSTNNQTKNSYRNINVKYDSNTEILNIDFVQENSVYGILFSNIVERFVSINAEDSDAALKILNIDKQKIEQYNKKYNITNIIKALGDKSEEVKTAIINFERKVNKNQYEREGEEIITLSNDESVTTKAYSLKLTKNQTRTLVSDVLEALGEQDRINELDGANTLFSEMKIIIYVAEDKTVRLEIETENKNIRVDIYENELNIKYKNSDEQESGETNFNIKSQDETKHITFEKNDTKIVAEANIEAGENTTKLRTRFSLQNQNIVGLYFELQQNITEAENVEVSKKIDNQSNILLNSLNENAQNQAISSLLKMIDKKLEEEQGRINSEVISKWIEKNKKLEEEYETRKEREKNEFNNQFLLYQGTNIEKNMVSNMMDLVEKNLSMYQVNGEYKTKIYLEEGKENKEMAQEIRNRLENARDKFNISFEYNSDGKLNAIIVEAINEGI